MEHKQPNALLERQLEEQLTATHEVRLYRRLLGVREYLRGRAIAEIAEMLDVSRQSIYNWIMRYEASGQPAALEDQPRSGRPARWTSELEQQLQGLMSQPPEAYGYLASSWTVPLLQQHFQQTYEVGVSDDTIRRALHRLGYVWKRYRYVLEPDAELEKKTLPPGADRCAAPAHGALSPG
jgi:transposase